MKLGSLFDGSGGFPLAGVLHGVEPVWASEIEPYPVRVTTARFPAMKHLGDVTKIDGAAIEPVDIITFGSPCQDLSVAGKQAGLHKGERSNLFFEAIRIIKEMRESTDGIYPRIAVWENVPGAFSSNKGEDFRAVLQAFCSVKDEAADVPRPAAGKWNPAGAIVGNGWSVAWRTFDAQYWGVPQRRKRIYLIADFGSERAGEILFEPEGLRGDTQTSGEKGQGVAGDAEGSAGRGVQCLNPWDCQSKRVFTTDSIYPTLPAMSGGGANNQAICFQASGDRDNPSISTSEKAYCIPANPMSDRGQAVCFQQNQREEVRNMGDKTGAIAANGGAHQTNYVCAFMGGQGDRARSIAWTEEAAPPLKAVPSGSNTVPTIVFKERAGCPGGGKGILCGDKPFTLSTLTDQAVCYAVRTAQTNANGVGVAQDAHTLDGANAQAVCYAVDRYNQTIADTMQTVRPAVGGDNVGAVCYPIDSHQQDSRFKICEDGVCPTVPGQMGTGGNNGAMVLYTKQAIGHYCELKAASTQQARQYKSADDLVVSSAKPPRRYIIRRLTPLECARLQGFPDDWCSGLGTENPTEDEIAFWAEVWEAHRRTMGRSGKAKSRNQIIKWLKDPRSDSAEYKMWGNGLALPNAAHVVGCAVKLIKEEQT